jgi:hypothetical protein
MIKLNLTKHIFKNKVFTAITNINKNLFAICEQYTGNIWLINSKLYNQIKIVNFPINLTYAN